jgi:hypothetical protein
MHVYSLAHITLLDDAIGGCSCAVNKNLIVNELTTINYSGRVE